MHPSRPTPPAPEPGPPAVRRAAVRPPTSRRVKGRRRSTTASIERAKRHNRGGDYARAFHWLKSGFLERGQSSLPSAISLYDGGIRLRWSGRGAAALRSVAGGSPAG